MRIQMNKLRAAWCAIFAICIVFGVVLSSAHGADKAIGNLGLARWKMFEQRLSLYRALLLKGAQSDDLTQKEIREYVQNDLTSEISNLSDLYKGRLMLFASEATKKAPGLREGELESVIRGRIAEIADAFLGFHSKLHDDSTLLERLDVSIKVAKDTEALFPSGNEEHGHSKETKNDNKSRPANQHNLQK